MSIPVAVAAGIAAAGCYGAATAGQHASAYHGSSDPGRLLRLLRDPRWLVATAGDGVGVLLHALALANGPIVLVQPLLVLALPTAVAVRPTFGGHRPTRSDLLGCGLVVLALTAFFALLGQPMHGRIISTAAALTTCAVALVVGGVALLATWRSAPARRAVVVGAVAGCWFGVVSVLVEAVAVVWHAEGLEGFVDARGLAALLGIAVLGAGGYLLVQFGFQIGPLAASFAINLVLDPVVAVVLGAAVLDEHVALGGLRILGYACCAVAVGWAAFRLAEPPGPATSPSATMDA